jgi:anti-sigma28 factor (negative regulator of flagellin synthesis)
MRVDPSVVVFPVATPTSSDPRAPQLARGARDTAVVSLSESAAATSAERPAAALDARLERIRAQIDRGDYPIDLELLASRIVDDDLLRGGA